MSSAPPAALNVHDRDTVLAHRRPRRVPGLVTAHLAGAPVEELLPLLATGGAAVAAAMGALVRSVVVRGHRRPRQRAGGRTADR
jgi:hypothetical protein